MKDSVEATLYWGGAVKSLIMILGELGITAFAIYSAVNGDWIAAALAVFVASPIWFVVSDIATGLVLLPIAGIAHLLGRKEA